MKSNRPAAIDVVLVGAGHAHVQVLRDFGMKPVPGVRLTLVTPDAYTPYSGMLPGLIAGHYSFADAHIDTRPLARFVGARLHLGACIGIDRAAGTMLCDNHAPIRYDLLSIDTGSVPNTGGVPGAAAIAVPVKPINGFLGRFEGIRRRVLDAHGAWRIAVIGGGAGGVELALSVERRLARDLREAGDDPGRLCMLLITAGDRMLEDFPRKFGDRFEALLARRGIEIATSARVASLSNGALHIEGKGQRAADDVLWVTEAQAPDWLKATGMRLDQRGFLCVGADLRVLGEERIFAAGDVMAFAPRPLPKSGVYAVRAGPVLAENIRRLASGAALIGFEPQRDALTLISTGERHAIGTRNGFVFGGHWVWRWKDWIDRRFMARFKDLPAASQAPSMCDESAP